MAGTSSETKAERELRRRERAALDELAALGFKVTIHRSREFVAGDVLLGTDDHWRSGECYAVCYSTDGRRRGFSGISATQVLADAQTWLRWQANVEPPMRFVLSPVPTPAVRVVQHAGSEQTRRDDRERMHRRTLTFDPRGELAAVEESN